MKYPHLGQRFLFCLGMLMVLALPTEGYSAPLEVFSKPLNAIKINKTYEATPLPDSMLYKASVYFSDLKKRVYALERLRSRIDTPLKRTDAYRELMKRYKAVKEHMRAVYKNLEGRPIPAAPKPKLTRAQAIKNLTFGSKLILEFATLKADPVSKYCTKEPAYPSVDRLISYQQNPKTFTRWRAFEPFLRHHDTWFARYERVWKEARDYFPPRLRRARWRNKITRDLKGQLGPELKAQLKRLKAMDSCNSHINTIRGKLKDIYRKAESQLRANDKQMDAFREAEKAALYSYKRTLSREVANKAAYYLGRAHFPRTLSIFLGNAHVEHPQAVPHVRALLARMKPVCARYKNLKMLGQLKRRRRKKANWVPHHRQICNLAAAPEKAVRTLVGRGVTKLSKAFFSRIADLPSPTKGLANGEGFVPFDRSETRTLSYILDYNKSLKAVAAHVKPLLDAVPMKPDPKVFEYYTKLHKAIWAEIDRLAVTFKLPKLKRGGKGLKVAMRFARSGGAKVYGGHIDKNWLLHKNALGIPVARTKDGFVVFRKKGEKWCRQERFIRKKSFVVKKLVKKGTKGIVGGKFQAAKGVEIGYFRFVKCP